MDCENCNHMKVIESLERRLIAAGNPSAASAGSTNLLEELVREAMKIAMFDMPYDDDSVPEVRSMKSEFRAAFKSVLKDRR